MPLIQHSHITQYAINTKYNHPTPPPAILCQIAVVPLLNESGCPTFQDRVGHLPSIGNIAVLPQLVLCSLTGSTCWQVQVAGLPALSAFLLCHLQQRSREMGLFTDRIPGYHSKRQLGCQWLNHSCFDNSIGLDSLVALESTQLYHMYYTVYRVMTLSTDFLN